MSAWFRISLMWLFLFIVFKATAGDSYRTSDGRLLKIGMTRIEVLSMVGQPLSKDVETIGINLDRHTGGETVETWSYVLEASIGGANLVTVTLRGGAVIAIHYKQRGRM